MYVVLVFLMDIMGRVIDVDIEWFYVRVWIILLFIVCLIKLLLVFIVKFVV